MMAVFDRVVSSGIAGTLMLALLMVGLLLAMGGFEWVRSLVLISSNRLNRFPKRVSDAAPSALLTAEWSIIPSPFGSATAVSRW